jgi:hypothetical protein
MFTTLARLKDARACIPGYTRMLSFFSTAQNMKDVQIPLYMIPIIGEADDCTWALDHAATFDRGAYDKFYATHFWAVLDRVFGRQFNNHFSKSGVSEYMPQAVQEAILSYFDIKSNEDALAWYDRWCLQSAHHWIWEEVLCARALRVPKYFIKEVLDNLTDGLPDDFQFAIARHHLGLPALTFAARPTVTVDDSDDREEDSDDGDDEESDDIGDDDEDTAPRRYASKAKKRIPNSPSDADINGEDDPLTKARMIMQRLYRMSSSMAIRELKRLGVRTKANRMYESRLSKAENMTRMLTCGADPYPLMVQFIVDNNLPELNKVKGFMLSQADDKEPPGYHLTFNSSDPRTIFRLFHLLKASNLDVVEMFGVNALAEEVSAAARDMRSSISAAEFDRLSGERDANNRVVLRTRPATAEERARYVPQSEDELL